MPEAKSGARDSQLTSDAPDVAAPPLRVGAAMPDPPFEFAADADSAGFDIDLMRMIANRLGRQWRLVRYRGADFDEIFAGLANGLYDCVASGATITPDRLKLADFCAPYIMSGQSLVVDVTRHPDVCSIDDLEGLSIGVQSGNTSEPVARALVAAGKAGSLRVYAYDDIEQALADLSRGGCDVFMKLAPVMHWMVRGRPNLKVVQTGITQEALGISVRRGDTALKQAIDDAQAALRADGELQRLINRWLGEGATPPPLDEATP